jgi:hypothetical protein
MRLYVQVPGALRVIVTVRDYSSIAARADVTRDSIVKLLVEVKVDRLIPFIPASPTGCAGP